jgi:hypothetical protein
MWDVVRTGVAEAVHGGGDFGNGRWEMGVGGF